MDKVIGEIYASLKENLKNPKLYIGIIVLITIFVMIFPYIDANFLYFNRIEKRIDILQSVSSLDLETIDRDSALQEEYKDILSEIEAKRSLSVFDSTGSGSAIGLKSISLLKFLTGGILAWLMAIVAIFISTVKSKFSAFIIFLLLGFLLGGVGYILPTIGNPYINFIGFPVLQVITLVSVAININKNNKI